MTDQTNAPAGAQLSPAAIIQEQRAQIDALTQRGYLLATALEQVRAGRDAAEAQANELQRELTELRNATATEEVE